MRASHPVWVAGGLGEVAAAIEQVNYLRSEPGLRGVAELEAVRPARGRRVRAAAFL